MNLGGLCGEILDCCRPLKRGKLVGLSVLVSDVRYPGESEDIPLLKLCFEFGVLALLTSVGVFNRCIYPPPIACLDLFVLRFSLDFREQSLVVRILTLGGVRLRFR